MGRGEEVGLLPHRLRRLLVRIRGNKQRDPRPPLPPYFRNCENVGGTAQEDEPTEHQARRRSPHSNGRSPTNGGAEHSGTRAWGFTL